MALSYAFNSETETPATVARRRAIADMLAGRIGRAQNTGEGLGDLISGIAGGFMNYRANKGEAAGNAQGDALFNSLALTGAPQAPEMGAGFDVPPPATSARPAGRIASEGARMAQGDAAKVRPSFNGNVKDGIAATAQALGVKPEDLATAISYETAGTFDPTKAGPRTQWGQHKGLIQFGEPQAKKYGVNWNDPINSQLGENGAVAKYLRDTGVKPGMGLLDIYSAINAGGVGKYNASDANNGGAPGTVADKVNKQMAGHRAKAMAMFGGNAPQAPVQVASNNPAQAFQAAQPMPVPQANQVAQQPMQGNVQPAASSGPDMNALLKAMASPYLKPEQRAVLQTIYQQQVEQNDPMRQLQMQAAQQGLTKNELEIEQMRNPAPQKPIEVGGRLIDPQTFKPLYEPPVDTNDANEWGLNPIPIRDPKTGQLKLMITNKSGVQKMMDLPDGFEAAPNLQYLDTGTGYVPVDKRGGSLPQEIAPVTKDVAGQAAATATGKLTAEANVALPGAETKGQEALSMIEQLANHPALASNTGGIEGRLPAVLQDMRDPKSADFRARLEQVKGQSFLSAFEALRGAGAITEQEGAAATKAMARLDQAQSDADFKTALKDLQGIIVKGIFNARVKAGKEKPASGEQLVPPAKRVEEMTDQELEALVNGQ